MNAGATVEGAATYLAFFNEQLHQAAALIMTVSPTGYQDLQFGLKGLEEQARRLMQESARVAAGITQKGVNLASDYPPW